MIKIDIGLVTKLIEDQFPDWKHLLIKAVDISGWDNRMFRLGEEMVIRLPTSKIYEDKIEKEYLWLPKLAINLPCIIPSPLAMGAPSLEYPLKWSIYNWIEGEMLFNNKIEEEFIYDLAKFIKGLHKIDTEGGPLAGMQNFYRGGDLKIYDEEARRAFAVLKNKINYSQSLDIWERAISSKWDRNPVWIHGDLSSGNILVAKERLKAVIDFGGLGVGDPSCDLVIAYNFFDQDKREIFKFIR